MRGRLIGGGDDGIDLVERGQGACVVAELLHGFKSDVLSLVFGQDGEADFGSLVYGVEVAKVGEPDGEVWLLLDDEPHLAVGEEVVLRIL